jgi:hypothetical protein
MNTQDTAAALKAALRESMRLDPPPKPPPTDAQKEPRQ